MFEVQCVGSKTMKSTWATNRGPAERNGPVQPQGKGLSLLPTAGTAMPDLSTRSVQPRGGGGRRRRWGRREATRSQP